MNDCSFLRTPADKSNILIVQDKLFEIPSKFVITWESDISCSLP